MTRIGERNRPLAKEPKTVQNPVGVADVEEDERARIAAWRSGQAMTLEEAVALALEDVPPGDR